MTLRHNAQALQLTPAWHRIFESSCKRFFGVPWPTRAARAFRHVVLSNFVSKQILCSRFTASTREGGRGRPLHGQRASRSDATAHAASCCERRKHDIDSSDHGRLDAPVLVMHKVSRPTCGGRRIPHPLMFQAAHAHQEGETAKYLMEHKWKGRLASLS